MKDNYKLDDLYSLFKGKNILVFDLETTGLPKASTALRKDNFDCYKKNKLFNSSRIIQVGWSYTENWNGKFNSKNVNAIYRKCKHIKRIDNTFIHGITLSTVNKEGMLLSKIINKSGFGYALKNTDYIIAHNAGFDVYILLNELYRINYGKRINSIMNLLKKGNVICTLKYARGICTGRRNLAAFYEHYYNEVPKILHRADEDVKVLLDILNKLVYDAKIKN
jgi:DNA polymerase III epsilon subunit-like protein